MLGRPQWEEPKAVEVPGRGGTNNVRFLLIRVVVRMIT